MLGQEAMGLGDVTLMAMIGSFLGWQPVLFVFLLAPFCGIVVGLVAKTMLNRSYVPYGPYLSVAALLRNARLEMDLDVGADSQRFDSPTLRRCTQLGDPGGCRVCVAAGVARHCPLVAQVVPGSCRPSKQQSHWLSGIPVE